MDFQLKEAIVAGLNVFLVILETQVSEKVSDAISLAFATLVILRIGGGRSWTGRWRARRRWAERRVSRNPPAAYRVRAILTHIIVSVAKNLMNFAVIFIVAIIAVICPFISENAK